MNRNEVRKYNPVNITPDHLFCPPTADAHEELRYLIKLLDETLKGTRTPGSTKRDRKLLVGTEFEILFFNPEIDPWVARNTFIYGTSSSNPNYKTEHTNKLTRLLGSGLELHKKHPGQIQVPNMIGRLSIEFRTQPQPVSDHLATVTRLGDDIREGCIELGILPVIHSQHLHISLRNNPRTEIHHYELGKEGFIPLTEDVDKEFAKVYPLVVLPEEWEYRAAKSSNILKDDDLDRLGDSFYHPEFRKLSSEFAHDPVLNLLLCLKAMYTTFLNTGRVSEGGESESAFFEVSVGKMRKDKSLENFFGRSTLDRLSGIVAQYPAVSRREITVDQIK